MSGKHKRSAATLYGAVIDYDSTAGANARYPRYRRAAAGRTWRARMDRRSASTH